MMSSKKILGTAIVAGAIGFMVSPLIWPVPETYPGPTQVQMVLLLGAAVIDALFFGLGVSLLMFGWDIFKKNRPGTGSSGLAFSALVWIIISWLPHSGFHRVNGEDISGLIAIEYAFHATVMLAGSYLAYFLLANSISARSEHN